MKGIKKILILCILILNGIIVNNSYADGDCNYTSKDGFEIHIVGFCSDIGVYFSPDSNTTKEEFLQFYREANDRYSDTMTAIISNTIEGYTSDCGGSIKIDICKQTKYTYSAWSTCTNDRQTRTETITETIEPYGTCSNDTRQATTQSCDSTPPVQLSISYTSGWTNTAKTITVKAKDAIKLKKMVLYQSKNGDSWTIVKTWDNLNSINTLVTKTWNRTAIDGSNFKYRLIAYDNVGNNKSTSSDSLIKFDTTNPTVTDNYSYDGIWTNGTSKTITLTPSDTGGSGVKVTKYCKTTSSSCTSNITGTSLTINADYNGKVQYETWDNAGNSSGEKTIIVKLDNTKPTVSYILEGGETNKWTNNNVKAKIKCSDSLSGCDSTTYQYRLENSSFSCNSTGTWNNGEYKTITSEGIKFICFRAKDKAGNGYSYSSVAIIKVDKTPPKIEDIKNLTPEKNSFILATDSKNFRFTVDKNNGSDITYIGVGFENYNTVDDLNTIETSSNGNWSKNENISNVDKGVNNNGYREYTLKIVKICDEAGNCSENLLNIYYNVYANDIDLVNSTISQTDDLSNGTKIADGTNNNVTIKLKDQYGNEIVPVGSPINRNVRVEVNYYNSLYLDQYNQSGNSSVQIGNNILNIGNNKETPNSGIFKNQANGEYNLDFKVYSPTTNAYDKVKGSFKVNKITASVSDITGDKNFASDIEFKFKPIYKLSFRNIGAKKYRFNEGIFQDAGLTFSGSNSNTSEENIYLEFGKYEPGSGNVVNTDFDLIIKENTSTGKVVEGHRDDISELTKKAFSNFNFETKLTQQNTSVLSYDLTYLASFVKYDIDGKTIAYPTDIIGKNTYSSGTGTNSDTLKGIKVLGKTYSKNAKNISGNQDPDINKVSGKIAKGLFRKVIRKNAYDLVKNLDINININNYKELLNNNLIYYKMDGGKIKYSEIQSSYKTNGKTILIIGGDLIIDGNIDVNGIMGIVVLKNIEGKGGEILIDDDVLKINATIYADKALFPYDDNYLKRVLTFDDGEGYFKNQLLINGSVFSYNTIGGARGDNLKCAYYSTNTCNIEEAQKYDLNFMRRYFVYDDDNDSTTPKIPANNGSGAVLDTDPNYEYPLIIKYNPLIQIAPPPLFSR